MPLLPIFISGLVAILLWKKSWFFALGAGGFVIWCLYSTIVRPNPIEQTEAHWKNTVRAELPIGTSKVKFIEWYKKRNLGDMNCKDDTCRVLVAGYFKEEFHVVVYFDREGKITKRDLEVGSLDSYSSFLPIKG